MMEVVGQMLMVPVLLVLLLAVAVVADAKYMFNCKFSNEGCESDEECCSGACLQAHPGTNHRCTRSSLHGACLYNYQCEERLTCGTRNTCCSKYWGTCSKDRDCCHPDLRCLEADGFYYKRCLMGQLLSSGASRNGGAGGISGLKVASGWWSLRLAGLWALVAMLACLLGGAAAAVTLS